METTEMTDINTTSLVIFLHGVGSSGSNLAGLAEAWSSTLTETEFAYPDAPFPSSFGLGYQWFSVAGVTEENRPARVGAARAAFDAVLTEIIARHGFQDRLHRVALVGFSQGTIMALDAVASGRWTFGAVLGFSGRLASPEPLSPTATPILLIHGTADPVIPASESKKAAERLIALGRPVDTWVEPNLGHSISREGMLRGGRFLAGALQN
jgi:phospholipase/carboxylesterase